MSKDVAVLWDLWDLWAESTASLSGQVWGALRLCGLPDMNQRPVQTRDDRHLLSFYKICINISFLIDVEVLTRYNVLIQTTPEHLVQRRYIWYSSSIGQSCSFIVNIWYTCWSSSPLLVCSRWPDVDQMLIRCWHLNTLDLQWSPLRPEVTDSPVSPGALLSPCLPCLWMQRDL